MTWPDEKPAEATNIVPITDYSAHPAKLKEEPKMDTSAV
jgi:hypothetical protein